MPEEFVNQLHYGDNLVRLRGDGVDKAIPDEIVDLVYLDPPFKSDRNYNLLFKQQKGERSPAQIMTFEDTWTYSHLLMSDFKSDQRNSDLFEVVDSLYKMLGPSEMMAYILMMAPRLLELRRKLKESGSLFLHCDPVASHYLKLVLDVVFGPQNFLNEITWKRTTTYSDAKSKFPNVADIILFYQKSDKFKFRPVYKELDQKYVDSFYKFDDNDGRGKYQLDNMAAPAGGGMAAINKKTGLPNGWYEYKGFPPPPRGWRYSPETMAKLDSEGRIHFPRKKDGSYDYSKRLRRKRYLEESKGELVSNVWTDIEAVQGLKSEYRCYPTQKPLALLERIIESASNVGDLILDPFAGCGTALVAAERLERKWIGIDVTYLAINEVVDRLKTEKIQNRDLVFELLGTPKDEDAARALFSGTAHQNHKPFEQWAVTLVGGKYNDKRGADRGVDGRIQLWDLEDNYQEAVIQVKGGNSLNLSNVRDFAHVIEQQGAVFGIMIGQKEPTKEMKLVAESMGYANWPGSKRIPRYQILSTKGLLEGGEKAIVPDTYRIQAGKGVGKVVDGHTKSLFEETD